MAATGEMVAPGTERTADGLVGRLFEASIQTFDLMSVYVGDRLGLYRAAVMKRPPGAHRRRYRGGLHR